jgi:MFS family permease
MAEPFAAAPSRVRYGVLAFACTLAGITYLDRLCFGSSQAQIRDALGLSSVDELSSAFAAFSLAYAAFEVPTGWLGDVFGPRATLIRIVLWWSFFTAVTAFVGIIPGFGLTALVVARFLFGVGEAGAFPNITRALHNWFPAVERGMAQGYVWMSSRIVGGLTPLFWTGLIVWIGVSWRLAFVIFGLVGVIWCIAFARRFRNRPDEVPEVNDAERALIRGDDATAAQPAHARVPWPKLLRSGNLWALCIMYFMMAYGWYFNVNYLPAYLEEMHGLNKSDLLGNSFAANSPLRKFLEEALWALFKGGPLLLGAAGCILGGWLTDWYIRRTRNRKWGRRVFGMIGHGACVPLYLYCIVAPNAWTFAIALALTGFSNDLAIGSAWATCQDIGRRHAAIVAGCMNTIGNLGGFASAAIVGWLLRASRQSYLARANLAPDGFAQLSQEAKRAALLPGYEWNFASFAALYAVAVGLWLLIDATRPVLPEDMDNAVSK